jgi:UDP-N-acetylglucosamine--N-acetylmuramyl-(pentapeptide) pyrophosphoryl-undecaprenol N-acetylglucosamine transferase
MVKKIMLATGGTGGHIFPAHALACALTEKSYQVFLIVDERYKQYVSNYNTAQTFFLAVDNIRKPGFAYKLNSAVNLLVSLLQAIMIMVHNKPDLVIGFGGYPSVPTLLAAKLLRIKTIIHEQNTVLGRANKFFACLVDKIALGFPVVKNLAEKYRYKTLYVGNPVRQEISQAGDYFISTPLKLLIIGGSQGAKIFSEVLPKSIALLAESLKKNLHITQQVRAEDQEITEKLYQQLNVTYTLAPFFSDLASQMNSASLIISRAGASSIAELIAAARPAILVPYPYAAQNHQVSNAEFYTSIKAGWMISQEEFSEQNLAKHLTNLLRNPELLQQAHQQARKTQINATITFSELVEKML